MDQIKIGELIRALRVQKGLTQKSLAEAVGVGDKAVSKWERGLGCPDVSLLPELSRVLGVRLEALLSGELDANDQERGNMKKLRFYVCPDCGNLITATGETGVSCCGKHGSLWSLRKQRARTSCRWKRSTTAGSSPLPTL